MSLLLNMLSRLDITFLPRSNNFLEEISSLSHSIVFLYFFALSYFKHLSLLFFGTLHSNGYIFPLPFNLGQFRKIISIPVAFQSLGRVGLFGILWTVDSQAPLCPWDSPGKSTRVGSRFLLQGIFPTQRIEPGSPVLQTDTLPSEPPVSSIEYIQIPLLTQNTSSGSLNSTEENAWGFIGFRYAFIVFLTFQFCYFV